MSKAKLAVIVIFVIAVLTAPSAQGKVPLTRDPAFHAIAWEHQGRVKLAIANTSPERQEFSVGFGYYLLGQRILEETAIQVPGQTILVTTHPMVWSDAETGYRTADMVFLRTRDGESAASAQIIGLHPATEHYRVDRFIVSAGQDAVMYIETPDPELGVDTTVYLSIGRNFNLGNYKGRVMVDKVYEGGLKRASDPPFGKGERPQDFHNYSYSWRGLRITAPTPKRFEGVQQLEFVIEEFVSTPEGTARHGLSAPPILVYGSDIILMEQ